VPNDLTILLYVDAKHRSVGYLIYLLRNYDFQYPEFVQIFYKNESDFKFRIIDIFPDKQKVIEDDEGIAVEAKF
jgi:hypothetical protein